MSRNLWILILIKILVILFYFDNNRPCLNMIYFEYEPWVNESSTTIPATKQRLPKLKHSNCDRLI